MPFTAYATAEDIEEYVLGASEGLWGGSAEDAESSLARAAKEINERLGGLDRISTVPIEEGDDGYAEVLIKLNVYMAVYNRVAAVSAGELFEDNWEWIRILINQIWSNIEKGIYRFGDAPEESSASAKMIHLGRATP